MHFLMVKPCIEKQFKQNRKKKSSHFTNTDPIHEKVKTFLSRKLYEKKRNINTDFEESLANRLYNSGT